MAHALIAESPGRHLTAAGADRADRDGAAA